ncbi:hypothetical protein FRX31_017096, partial [Thalictrum thalictroides]
LLPSPTTGTFPSQAFNWRANSNSFQQVGGVKQEDRNYSDFSFQPQTKSSSGSIFQSSLSTVDMYKGQQQQQQPWSFQEATKQADFSTGKPIVKPETVSSQNNGATQSDY